MDDVFGIINQYVILVQDAQYKEEGVLAVKMPSVMVRGVQTSLGFLHRFFQYLGNSRHQSDVWCFMGELNFWFGNFLNRNSLWLTNYGFWTNINVWYFDGWAFEVLENSGSIYFKYLCGLPIVRWFWLKNWSRFRDSRANFRGLLS